MASASAGRSSTKSAKRLRTVGQTKKGRWANKKEIAANNAANSVMKSKFKRSIAGVKGQRGRRQS